MREQDGLTPKTWQRIYELLGERYGIPADDLAAMHHENGSYKGAVLTLIRSDAPKMGELIEGRPAPLQPCVCSACGSIFLSRIEGDEFCSPLCKSGRFGIPLLS